MPVGQQAKSGFYGGRLHTDVTWGYFLENVEGQHNEFVLHLVDDRETQETSFLSDGVTVSELCFIKINLAARI